MLTLVADDHQLIREGLCRLLEAAEGGEFETLQAQSWPECLEIARQHPLQLAIVDLYMPGHAGAPEGHDGLAALRSEHPDLQIIVLSGSEDPDDALRVLGQGVRGFVLKGEPSEVLMSAIQLVLAGGTYLPTSLLNHPRIIGAGHAATDHAEPSEATAREGCNCSQLTQRQREVLQRMAVGESNKAIARQLNLSPWTVKTHVAAILETLAASNRTEAGSRLRAPCATTCCLND